MKSAQIKERELILKLYNEGKKQEVIASILGCSQSKVSFWIIRYKKDGKFDNKPRSGRPTKLNGNKLASLKARITDKFLKAIKTIVESLAKKLKKLLRLRLEKDILLDTFNDFSIKWDLT